MGSAIDAAGKGANVRVITRDKTPSRYQANPGRVLAEKIFQVPGTFQARLAHY
jgi:hypothetical protein